MSGVIALVIILVAVLGVILTPDKDKGCDPGPDCATCPFPCNHRPKMP